MKRWHDGHDRRSLRLLDYDYASCGAYFVTIRTHARDHLFGEIIDGEMVLNDRVRDLGKIWARTVNGGTMPQPYGFVVMPNHVHGVVWLPRPRRAERWPIPVGAKRPPARDVDVYSHGQSFSESHPDSVDASPLQHHDHVTTLRGPEPNSLGATVRSFKSESTRAFNRVRNALRPHVWQRGYHERVVRNERGLAAVRQYILDNPKRWVDDPNNVRV